MRGLTGLVAGALLVGGLTACSGGTGSYCDDFSAAAGEFRSFENVEPVQLPGLLDTLQSLGDDAPDEVGDAWQTVDAGIQDFEQAVADTGLSLEDLADPGSLDPSDLGRDGLERLDEASQQLQGPEFQEAIEEIRTHAESECDISFGGGGQ